jgi:hypothetical protein
MSTGSFIQLVITMKFIAIKAKAIIFFSIIIRLITSAANIHIFDET